jgi:alkylation response protein AidB-like acyl-CoA dehydrogenase
MGMDVRSSQTRSALLHAVADLGPRIEALADEIERARQLAEPLVASLIDAGLFRMLLPAGFGGHEVDPITFATVIEAVARHDASTAWCLCQASGCSMIAAALEPAVAQVVFDGGHGILAWGPSPDARAEAVEGGYRVTGQWSFASGCRHATWLGGVCTVVGPDGSPRRRPDAAPDIQTMLFPATAAEIIDVWHVSGLRGTGSDTVVVADLFVPAEYAARRDDPTQVRETGPLYRFPLNSLYATGFSSVALGVARRMLDEFIVLAHDKTPRAARSSLRESAVVQAQVAQAEAQWRSARALLHTTLDEVWRDVCHTNVLTLAGRIQIRLAATYAIQQAARVADTAYYAAGATAIFAANPFERRFRDIHAVTQQVQGRQDHFETVGRFLLGLEPSQAFL